LLKLDPWHPPALVTHLHLSPTCTCHRRCKWQVQVDRQGTCDIQRDQIVIYWIWLMTVKSIKAALPRVNGVEQSPIQITIRCC